MVPPKEALKLYFNGSERIAISFRVPNPDPELAEGERTPLLRRYLGKEALSDETALELNSFAPREPTYN
jgi:hypothetical protein